MNRPKSKKGQKQIQNQVADPGSKERKLIPWTWASDPMTDAKRLPMLAERVFDVIQTLTSENYVSQSSTAPVSLGLGFSIANLNGISAYTGIFDQYRVLGWELVYTPNVTDSIPFTTTGAMSGLLYTVIDYDDVTPLTAGTSPQLASAYANCITCGVTKPQRRCLSPRLATAAFGSGVFSSFANNSSKMWIDAASANVVYFGVKTVIDIGTAGNLATYDLTQRVHLQFRAVR